MILEVIGRARRRLLWIAMAAQGARAVCTSLGLLILLLVLGTDILDWRYVLCVPGASLLAGAYFACRRIPGSHGAARILDRRLGLQDAISTALFFWPGHPQRDFDEGMRQAQRAYAARIAAGISMRQALPLKLPRLVYAGAALALMACGLVGWRYSVHGRLDLRRPAAPAVAHLIDEMKAQVANLEQFLKQLDPDRPQVDKAAMLASLAEKGDTESKTDSKTDSKGQAEGANGSEPQAEKQDSTMALDNPPEKQGEGAGEPQPANDGNRSEQRGSEQRNNDGQQGRQERGSGESDNHTSGSDSSLMNKVRDTMANLVSALKPGSGGRGGNPMDGERNARQQGAKSNGKAGAGDRQENSTASPSQGDPRDGDSQAQQGGSPSKGQPNGTESDKQAGSGAGRDEGDKRIKMAEAREAMGKISVILGKRSKEVTGSTTVEVVSGEQELKTQYENRQAKHAAVEDRAERDEVPLELQDYVRQYLQAARAAATAASSTGRGGSTGHASRAATIPK